MSFRRIVVLPLALAFTVALALPLIAQTQDDTPAPKESRRRKYKAPPEVSHIEVTVLKGFNKKPIANAAVIFHPMKNGKEEGNLEIKTDPDGKAVIDVIPTGSTVTVQVIADGFATYAKDYDVPTATRTIVVTMIRPQEQISAYENNSGKATERKPGVQEPLHPDPPPPPPASMTGSGTTSVK